HNYYEVELVSYPGQKLYLRMDKNHHPYVEGTINGQYMHVKHLFIKLKDGTSGLNVKADYILFHGLDKNGKPVKAKLYPSHQRVSQITNKHYICLMITAERYHDISCGHRVVGHEGKCRFLHGHNYRIHFEIQAESLDTVGRVIDFSVIKEKLCMWLEEHYDHKFLIWQEDP